MLKSRAELVLICWSLPRKEFDFLVSLVIWLFFNLTQLGVQDPIRAALRDDDKSAAENDGRNVNNVKVNLTAQQERGCKSYVKYTERLTKHQRSPKGKYY